MWGQAVALSLNTVFQIILFNSVVFGAGRYIAAGLARPLNHSGRGLVTQEKMAEGMEVDPTPIVRDKKRFEVKKVRESIPGWLRLRFLVERCRSLVVG